MAENEQMTIHERDLLKETLVCINLERNIWVKFGFPKDIQNGKITLEILKNLSGPPYVFTADVVMLFDKHHPNGVLLRDTTVILMHAGRTSVKSPWVFSSFEDGYPVVETVEEVNKSLINQGKKPIELVLACNNYTVDNESKNYCGKLKLV